jgi:hypothetical protein
MDCHLDDQYLKQRSETENKKARLFGPTGLELNR